jgi:hypothetical protein
MSCELNIHCLDCNDTNESFSTNNDAGFMRHVIKHRGLIASVAPLFEHWRIDELRVFNGVIRPEWFEKHSGHRLVIRDEYGRDEDP